MLSHCAVFPAEARKSRNTHESQPTIPCNTESSAQEHQLLVGSSLRKTFSPPVMHCRLRLHNAENTEGSPISTVATDRCPVFFFTLRLLPYLLTLRLLIMGIAS